ncbi:MAG: DUF2256 domain-containing protein, partial [Micrococcales bacterium]|nr:DUF2256 domain-containing protein [Micrococcales bacterium]NDE68489.1 DUF2256 domain-containing protein [Microbacteriaceae bacterium]
WDNVKYCSEKCKAAK